MNDLNCSIGGTKWPPKKTEAELVRDTGEFILKANGMKEKEPVLLWPWALLLALLILAMFMGGCGQEAWAGEVGMASYFSNVETEGRNCADGKYHDLSSEFVIASWRYRLGTLVRVSDMGGRSVVAMVVDRGPGRKNGTSAYYKGTRIADLSAACMDALGGISKGLIEVEITRVK